MTSGDDIDDIDELVDWQLDNPPKIGQVEMCPHSWCSDSWHGHPRYRSEGAMKCPGSHTEQWPPGHTPPETDKEEAFDPPQAPTMDAIAEWVATELPTVAGEDLAVFLTRPLSLAADPTYEGGDDR